MVLCSSHVGSRQPLNSNPNITAHAIGYLKASPNGQKLCCVSTNGYCIAEYFDFDKSTGIVSNSVNIQTDSIYNYYGVSFSPDNSKLYIAGDLNDYNIYQYNLNAGNGNPDSVRDSRTAIAIQNTNYFALQLATDGKIYVAHGNPTAYLGAITFPDSSGVNCNYVDSAVYLSGKTASYGLPNIIDSYDYSNTTFTCATGINEQNANEQPSVFPNPFNSELNIKTNYNEISEFILYDVPSRKLLQQSFTNSTTLNTAQLAKGIYLYEVRNKDGVIKKGKVVKD